MYLYLQYALAKVKKVKCWNTNPKYQYLNLQSLSYVCIHACMHSRSVYWRSLSSRSLSVYPRSLCIRGHFVFKVIVYSSHSLLSIIHFIIHNEHVCFECICMYAFKLRPDGASSPMSCTPLWHSGALLLTAYGQLASVRPQHATPAEQCV